MAQKERKRGRWQWGQEMARVGVWLGDEIAENGGSLEGEEDVGVGDVGGCRSWVGARAGSSSSDKRAGASSSEKRAGASSVGKKRSMTSQSRASAMA